MQNARNMRIVHQSAQNMCVVHLADRPGGGRRRFSRPAAALPPLPFCAPARSKMRIAGRRERRRRRPRRIPPPRLRPRASNLGRPITYRPEIRGRDRTPALDPPRGAGGLGPARRAQAGERCRQPIGPRARPRRQIACAGRLRPAKRPMAALAGRRDGPSAPLPAPGGPHGFRARASRHSPRIPCGAPRAPRHSSGRDAP